MRVRRCTRARSARRAARPVGGRGRRARGAASRRPTCRSGRPPGAPRRAGRRARTAPAPPARSRPSAWSAVSTRRGPPPPARARSATRRAGRRPTARAAARARARSWPARRCGRPRSRPTARRCRRTPARRTPRAARPGCRRHGARGHLPPRHPGADAVGGEQRVGGASVARLAAAELVGALHGRRGRRPGVGAPASARQGQEPAQRELHGVADDLAHAAAEGALVAGDLVDDGRHGAVGHVGQVGAHVGDHLGGEEDTVTSGASWSARGHSKPPELFPRYKTGRPIHP